MTIDDTYIAGLAEKLATEHALGTFERFERVLGRGEVNEVYLIVTDTTKAILRVNHASEYDRLLKEQWCIETVRRQAVPSPRVLAVGQDEAYAYTLTEFVDGKNGTDITDTTAVWEQLGIYLRIIHAVPAQDFGERLSDITSGNMSTWKRYLEYNIASLTEDDELRKLGVLDAAASDKLRHIFAELQAKDFTFGLNHGDYSLANVIVGSGGTPHIIDWGSAQGHVVPHHDFGVITDESLSDSSEEFAAFLNGYGLTKSEYESLKADIAKLMLLEAVDKLRWALDKSPDDVPFFKVRVKKMLLRV